MAKKPTIGSRLNISKEDLLKASQSVEEQVKQDGLKKIREGNSEEGGTTPSETIIQKEEQNITSGNGKENNTVLEHKEISDDTTLNDEEIVQIIEDKKFEEYFRDFVLGKEDKYTNITISNSINLEFKKICAFVPQATIRELASNILQDWLNKYSKEIKKLKKG